MQTLDNRLIILQLVYRYIAHTQNKPRIITHVHVDLRPWEVNLLERLFHLWLPLLHKCIEVGHIFRVVHSGWGSRLMQVLHSADPPWDLLGLLVSLFNWIYVHGRGTDHVFRLNVLQLKDSFIFVVQGGFIQDSNTEVLFVAVGLGHLQECINLPNGWDVVWNEGFYLSFKVDLLRLITLNVLKKFFNFTTDWKISVLGWVVCSWNFFLIIIIIILLILSAFLLLLLLHSWLLRVCLLLLCALLLPTTNVWLVFHINIDINFILVFVRFNFFTIVHIHRQIKRLIFNFLSLYVRSWCWFFSLNLGWLGHFLRYAYWHIIFFFIWELVLVLFWVKIFADFESIATLLRKLVFVVWVHCF